MHFLSSVQTLPLCLSIIALMMSLVFRVKQKEHLSLVFLLLTALLIFSFAALLDPFLNIWDERFHALVAKNMMKHPLMPTLYDDPVVNMPYDRWDRYHIWLHKPPLFLWQIMLSFKIFGVSEFTLRLPDVILGTAMVFAGYRSGKLLVNERVGYITGVLMITTLYFLELVSGRQEIDHNDFTFIAYVSLSLWTFIEYQFSGKIIWVILTGIFSGFAVLCKWLTGLVVYAGWLFLNIIRRKEKVPHSYRHLIFSFLISIIIIMPWQLLILRWYPAETVQANNLNMAHFMTIVEGKAESIWFHFSNLNVIYGSLTAILIIPAFYLLYRISINKKLIISLLFMVAGVYLFFTIAASKMSSFPLLISMIIFIAFATLIDFCCSFLHPYLKKKFLRAILFPMVIFIIVFLRFDLGLIEKKHSTVNPRNVYSYMLMYNKKVFTGLHLPPNTVLFNVRGREYVEAMFYTGLPAYGFIPTFEQFKDVRSKGRIIAVFRQDDMVLPDYLLKDPKTIIIDKAVKDY